MLFRAVLVFVAIVMLVVVSAALSQDVSVPAKVEGQPGEFVIIKAETKGTVVKWKVVDAGIFLFPQDLLKDTKTAVVTGLKPGSYRVWAWSAIGAAPTDAVECIIVLGDPGPAPPPPPPPPPPPADTPLVKALKEAAAKESPADKQHLPSFVIACRAAASEAQSSSNMLVRQVNESFVSIMKQTVGTRLPNVRAVVNAQLNARLPRSTNAVLDAPTRKLVADVFNELAASLELLQ